MKTNKIFIYFFSSIFLLIIILCFESTNKSVVTSQKEGNILVSKIEYFREIYGRLPNSLLEIGIDDVNNYYFPYYYDKQDSVYYSLYYGTTLGESEVFYSDTRTWESSIRDME